MSIKNYPNIESIYEIKKERRRYLRNLSIDEKIKIVEEMRDRFNRLRKYRNRS